MSRYTIFIIALLMGFCFFAGHYFNDSQAVQYDSVFLNEVGRRFAENHNYTLNEYDCKNYSIEFDFVLKSLGFESHIIQDDEENHVYNLIGIEPQTGFIRKTKDNIKYG